jgi:hypothetical protein
MSRSILLVLAVAGALGVLATAAPAAPAAAHHAKPAAARRGVVLSAGHGMLRLVDARHRVGDARVRSTRGLPCGAVVAIRGRKARVAGRRSTISFYGRVLRSSARGAVLELGDKSAFKLRAVRTHGARSRASAAGLRTLARGDAVLVTVAAKDARGGVALRVKRASQRAAIGDGHLLASGVVTDDTGHGSFGIRTPHGSGLRFSDPQRLFEAAQATQCDAVDVTYHAQGGALVVDALRVTGRSGDGTCAGSQAQRGGGGEVDGTVTALAPDDSSITLDPGDGTAVTIPVPDASLLSGVNLGDQVAVTTDDAGDATGVDVLDAGGGDQPAPDDGSDG